MSRKVSAGILLYRRSSNAPLDVEVLLGHPGGPFFLNRDIGHWTVPKGELGGGDDDMFATAAREFEEETGHALDDVARAVAVMPIDLGFVIQASGKRVHCWAIEGDLDPAEARSNTFEMIWPAGTGSTRVFPEIDRVAWFSLDEARRRANRSQSEFIDRLDEALARG